MRSWIPAVWILALAAPRRAVPDPSDMCRSLGLEPYGRITALDEWSDLKRDYLPIAHSRMVRVFRPTPSGPPEELLGDADMPLCHGDRVEVWHDGRVMLDHIYRSAEGAITTASLQAEGGAILELGDTIRQFRGAATYFSWDDILLTDDGPKRWAVLKVAVGNSDSGVVADQSTFRMEVEDPCACKVKIAVSTGDDPLTPGNGRSDRHWVLFRGRDAQGRIFQKKIGGGDAKAINLGGPAQSPVQPLSEPEREQAVHAVNQAQQQLVAPLRGVRERPPHEAYLPDILPFELDVEVQSAAAPGALSVDGRGVSVPRWREKEGRWTAKASVELGLGEHLIGVTVAEVALPMQTVIAGLDQASLKARFTTSQPVPAEPKPVPIAVIPARGGPTGQTWQTTAIPGAPMTFVELSGDTFLMGSADSDKAAYDNEKPQHRVTVPGFWMGRSEVTQAQWTSVVRAAKAGHDSNASALNETVLPTKGDALPVENVSWCEAVRYANALSRIEGLVPIYTVSADCETGGKVGWDQAVTGFRLPTEAEWEYAARAGTTTAYTVGDAEADLSRQGWYAGNSESRAHPVCTAAFQPWGLCDMAGNVWEWVWDFYTPSYATGADPTTTRGVRGGSYDNQPLAERSAFRSRNDPFWRDFLLGFRLVRQVPPAGDP